MTRSTPYLLAFLGGSVVLLALVLSASPLTMTKHVETNTNIGGPVIINTCGDVPMPPGIIPRPTIWSYP